MYSEHFGLKQEPFSIAPDPRYLFMSERHREALAHLLYGVGGGGGFVLLSGEIGAGKTTVCRCFLEQIPRRCNVAYIFNPKLTVTELLKSICDEFRIPYEHQGPGVATVKDYIDPLNGFLLKTHAVGQNNVLIIDEAQNLSADVLEQLRLLTNLETNERKLLQIILIGQPELREMLARPELEQLAQRVIARFHLEALSETETTQYIRHRLAVAGTTRSPFDLKVSRRIHQLTRGIPRRINLLCDRALLGAYAEGKNKVDREILEKAADEVFAKPQRATPVAARYRRPASVGLALAGLAALAGIATWSTDGVRRDTQPNDTLAKRPEPPASATKAASSAAQAASRGASAAPLLAAADLEARFKPLIREENDAWRELAPLWKLTLDDSDPCVAAQRQQVHCYRGISTLALIRQLGRPGILTLRDENNRPVYALLTGLGEQGATLRMGGVSQTVSLVSLARVWRGDFATFWRAPAGYANKIVESRSGPVGEWLSAQLTELQGEPPGSEKQPPDAALKAKVSAFQLAQGLKADGLAGPTTFMQLNRATGVDEPRLQTER